jgi:hypothetical protein
VPNHNFAYQISAPVSDPNDSPVFFALGTLPGGLSFDSTTGIISGIFQGNRESQPAPDLAGGVITNIQLFAANSHGTGTIPLLFQLAPPGAQNLSTRVSAGTGDDVLIGGFIITGNSPKQVVIRAIGPSLANGSLSATEVLSDPVLELHYPDDSIVINDNWRDSQEAAIVATKIQPENDRESAILANLAASDPTVFGSGSYTVIVHGKDKLTGVALVEVYDLGTASMDVSSAAQLVNISTRGKVQPGGGAMIGGFIIGAGSASDVLVRAIGPELTARGVANALQDPVLELLDGNGASVASNDDWQSDQEAQIFFTNLGPTSPREAAILRNLSPGPYVATVQGKNDATGVSLVEVYMLP